MKPIPYTRSLLEMVMKWKKCKTIQKKLKVLFMKKAINEKQIWQTWVNNHQWTTCLGVETKKFEGLNMFVSVES